MSRSKPKNILIDLQTDTTMSEAFKQLRTNIDFSGIDEAIQVVTITSTKNGEGKSTVAANLAIAYAQAGKKVLLVDGDLRKPSLHHFFHTTHAPGLTSVLAKQSEIRQAAAPTSIANLYLLPAGPSPASSTDMLMSKRMASVMEELKEMFDVIIIDAPSLLTNSDAQVLSAASDGVMFVVNSGKVKKEAVVKARESLSLAKARVLGAILNNIEPKAIVSYLK